jgi:hypothetical protein
MNESRGTKAAFTFPIRGENLPASLDLLQLEVDVHGVAVAGAEAGGWGVDFRDAG